MIPRRLGEVRPSPTGCAASSSPSLGPYPIVVSSLGLFPPRRSTGATASHARFDSARGGSQEFLAELFPGEQCLSSAPFRVRQSPAHRPDGAGRARGFRVARTEARPPTVTQRHDEMANRVECVSMTPQRNRVCRPDARSAQFAPFTYHLLSCRSWRPSRRPEYNGVKHEKVISDK
jgi:hypothetical protein